MSSRDPSRFARLDVLRGLAVLGVYCFHMTSFLIGAWNPQPHGMIYGTLSDLESARYWLLVLLSLGATGVPLFFVLSGFVIHTVYLRRPEAFTTWSFYRRRFWRIYPPYLVSLLGYTWLKHIPLNTRAGSLQFLSHLVMIHNFGPDWFFGINGVFWTLAVEFQLYLLYPLVVTWRKRFGMDRTLAITIAISAAALLFIYVLTRAVPPLYLWCNTITFWGDWTLGAWVAERVFSGKPVLKPYPAAMVILVPAAVLFSVFRVTALTYFPLWCLMYAFVLDRYVRVQSPLRLLESVLVPIGVWSYSFYLIHQPLMPLSLHAASRLLGHAPGSYTTPSMGVCLASFAALLPVVICLSFALYTTAERFGMKMGRPAKAV